MISHFQWCKYKDLFDSDQIIFEKNFNLFIIKVKINF